MADAPLAPPSREHGPHRPRPVLGYALVWSAVAFWSVNASVAKVVLESAGLSAMRLAEVRATGSALVLVAAVALLRPSSLRVSPRELAFLAAFGILGLAFVQLFYFVAIARLPIGIALVIQYLAPVFVALWARFVVHEPVRRRLWIAIALSLTGLTLVVELWSGFALDGVGLAACVAAALAYALYVLMAEHSLRRGRDTASLLAWGFVFAALFWTLAQPWWSFPAAQIAGTTGLLGRLEDVSAPIWLLLAYVVILGTVLPFALVVSALRHVPATRVTVVAMLEPVLAALVAFAWLAEEISGVQLAGGALVLLGVALAQTARARTA